MATKEAVGQALTTGGGALVKQDRIEQLLERVDIKKRFTDVLGAKANGFISSVISASKANDYLKSCDPMSIISSAAIAATLDLPINPSLGFAHIVPYKGKAQFQMGWKGFVQLAIRTGQYKTMNASEVFEGELKYWNRITGEFESDLTTKTSDKIVGYVAFFRTLNGFEKYLYMTAPEIEAHARKFSQSYGYDLREKRNSSTWSTNFDAMAKKTVLKLLLSKYGVLSIEMQKALGVDQAVVDAEGEVVEYPDNGESAGDAQEPVTQE